MKVLYNDGFQGYLSACAKLINSTDSIIQFEPATNAVSQLSLFDMVEKDSLLVKTDESSVQKFIKRIIKEIGQEFWDTLERAFRHSSREKEAYCYYALQLGFKHGPKVLEFRQDLKIARFMKMANAVSFEIHRYFGFTRFKQHKQPEFLYARISPQYDILEPLAMYFQVRLRAFSWIITTDTAYALWDQQQLSIGELSAALKFSEEDSVERLWKQYYHATTNLKRWNWRTFQNHLPILYQKYMPEKSEIKKMAQEHIVSVQKGSTSI